MSACKATPTKNLVSRPEFSFEGRAFHITIIYESLENIVWKLTIIIIPIDKTFCENVHVNDVVVILSPDFLFFHAFWCFPRPILANLHIAIVFL